MFCLWWLPLYYLPICPERWRQTKNLLRPTGTLTESPKASRHTKRFSTNPTQKSLSQQIKSQTMADYVNMPLPLGVGGATPFAMASNHPTATNHAFRDVKKFEPAKQTRIKCTFCGCWATRGEDCKQCRRPTAPVRQRRNNNVRVEVYNAPPSQINGGGGGGGGGGRNRSPRGDGGGDGSGEGSGPRRPRLSSYGAKMRAELLQRQNVRLAAAAASRAAAVAQRNQQNGFPPSGPSDVDDSQMGHHSPSPTRGAEFAEGAGGGFSPQGQQQPAAARTVTCRQCACFAMSGVPCSLCFFVNK